MRFFGLAIIVYLSMSGKTQDFVALMTEQQQSSGGDSGMGLGGMFGGSSGGKGGLDIGSIFGGKSGGKGGGIGSIMGMLK